MDKVVNPQKPNIDYYAPAAEVSKNRGKCAKQKKEDGNRIVWI